MEKDQKSPLSEVIYSEALSPDISRVFMGAGWRDIF